MRCESFNVGVKKKLGLCERDIISEREGCRVNYEQLDAGREHRNLNVYTTNRELYNTEIGRYLFDPLENLWKKYRIYFSDQLAMKSGVYYNFGMAKNINPVHRCPEIKI